MEEQFNKDAKEGWRFSADAAGITDEKAGSEFQKHTSGEVFVAVMPIPGNEGIIVQVWVNVRGGMRMFTAYFWHTEGWSPRNEAILEAVLKRATATKASMADSM